jgi:PAS domain-containing protein
MREQGTPNDEAGSPWNELLAGAAIVHQRALSSLSVPALMFDVPGRRIRAANQALADLFDVPVEEMLGRLNSDVVKFEDEEGMIRAIAALSSGAIDGYRARRRLVTPKGAVIDVIVWCRAIDVEGVRTAVYIVSRIGRGGAQQVEPPTAWAGPLIVGTTDSQWRIERVSSDVRDVLGWDMAACIHQSLLSAMQPDDARELTRAVIDTSVDRAIVRHVRLRHQDGEWVPMQCLCVRLSGDDPSAVAFTLLPEPPAAHSDRLTDMENRLRRIAAELRAAGVMDDIEHLPTYDEFPQLASLTSRQWEVVIRLFRGDRVATIASDLSLSPHTVRNHLAAIFERFDVHSQAELIALLSRR